MHMYTVQCTGITHCTVMYAHCTVMLHSFSDSGFFTFFKFGFDLIVIRGPLLKKNYLRYFDKKICQHVFENLFNESRIQLVFFSFTKSINQDVKSNDF